MLEPRNLFYTKTFVFLAIAFLSGSLSTLDDIQKNGFTFFKGGTLAIAFLSSVGVTIDKMEKEPNVFTFKGVAGRDIETAQENIQKVQPSQQQPPILSALPESIPQSQDVVDTLAQAVPQIKVSSDLQPIVNAAENFTVKTLLKGIFK